MILQNEHFMMKEQTRVKYKELASGENVDHVFTVLTLRHGCQRFVPAQLGSYVKNKGSEYKHKG